MQSQEKQDKASKLEIKSKPIGELTHYQEALLKKRKRDDADQRRRVDARAQQKMQQGRQKKQAEKDAAGGSVLMPQVYASNHMKQQRNYVHYKRNKARIELAEKARQRFSGASTALHGALAGPSGTVKADSLLLVIRIKGYNDGTTPQSQKILSDLGLRNINNAVFARADEDTMKKILMVNENLAYGYPTKKMVNELVRKRGFLRKDNKKEAITNNVLIEELLGTIDGVANGCICIEDIIDNIYNCHKPEQAEVFREILKFLWPMQIGSLKETILDANVAHQAHGREYRKKNTKVSRGGYVGFMENKINDFVKPLI